MTLGLAVCVLSSFLAGCGSARKVVPGSSDTHRVRIQKQRNIVEGQWQKAEEDDLLSGAYIYKLDEPLYGCSGLSVDYEVDIVSGESCRQWIIYVREYGEWYNAGTMTLSGGKGSEKFTFPQAMDIDALVTYPDTEGELEWDDHITVYDPEYSVSKQGGSGDGNTGGTWVEGSWTEERYDVNHTDTSAFQLADPIQNCRDLRVSIEVDMKHNTSCKDWIVYTWNGAAWVEIGNIYMPSGNGEAEADIHLSTPMDIEYIIVVPKVNGSFSWDCAIAVYDMN